MMMLRKPNRRLKRDYDRIFRKSPEAANLFLLLCELADERGQVQINEAEITALMRARFDDPREYAL